MRTASSKHQFNLENILVHLVTYRTQLNPEPFPGKANV